MRHVLSLFDLSSEEIRRVLEISVDESQNASETEKHNYEAQAI